MKTIEDLTVKVRYTVGLGNIKVPDKILKQLNKIADKGIELDDTNMEFGDAAEWLRDNIRERDCYNHSHEIIDLIEPE